MGIRLEALEFDANDPERLAAFWAAILGRELSSTTRLPGLVDTDFEVQFVPERQPKPAGRHRMHFDLTSASDEEQAATVRRALELGASHLDVGQRGDEGHVVLADPEGNEFCVIESSSRFLANTARIGGIAGEGMPEVGYFWSEVLGWPLVWDQDEETAIQSPRGGVKITWGGPPIPAKLHRNRLRWVLRATAPAGEEIHRLQEMGATIVRAEGQGVELADPEGNEFTIADVEAPQ